MSKTLLKALGVKPLPTPQPTPPKGGAGGSGK